MQRNLFWPVGSFGDVFRYLEIHTVQHNILWSGGGLYLEQMKQSASPESLCKVNIPQYQPETGLHAVLQSLTDLCQATVISQSEGNSSYTTFHADFLAQLMHFVTGTLEQTAYQVT